MNYIILFDNDKLPRRCFSVWYGIQYRSCHAEITCGSSSISSEESQSCFYILMFLLMPNFLKKFHMDHARIFMDMRCGWIRLRLWATSQSPMVPAWWVILDVKGSGPARFPLLEVVCIYGDQADAMFYLRKTFYFQKIIYVLYFIK